MPKLDALPVEIGALVASFLNPKRHYYDTERLRELRELLALRCASRSCKDAVRRAPQYKETEDNHYYLGGSSAQNIAAMGRVFGSGCRSLAFGKLKSEECVSALQNFVTSTKGQLRYLHWTAGGPSLLTWSALLEMCRASPLLTTFKVHGAPVSTANLDDFASAVSSACPLLEDVWLPCPRSAAEDYQWHFPRSEHLDFCRRLGVQEGSIRWEGIEATLRACVQAVGIDFEHFTVSSRLVDLLLGAPAASRLKALHFSEESVISPELILRFASSLGALSRLQLPHDFDGGTQFFRSLVLARPTIVRLDLAFGNVDHEELRIICEGLRLEHLDLAYNDIRLAAHHPNAVEVIVESQCAQTLRSIDLCYLPFVPEELLQLLRGCPKLAKLEWEAPEDFNGTGQDFPLFPIEDGPAVDAINALLKSRGGKAIRFFDEYGTTLRPPDH